MNQPLFYRRHTILAVCLIVFFSTSALLHHLSSVLHNLDARTNSESAAPAMGVPLTLQNSESYTMYLPLVQKPLFVPPSFVVSNRSFEEGTVTWSEFSTEDEPLIRNTSTLGVAPYRGDWAAQLGIHDNETAMIAQGVTIPGQLACLSYWEWIESSDGCKADYGGMGFDGKWHTVYSLCAGTATGGWVQRKIDVSGKITPEQTITLNFATVNDYSVPSRLYVDHISFVATELCTEATATPTPQAASAAATGKGHLDLSQLIGQPIVVSNDLKE